jgi:chemotaxis protein MotA
MGLIHVLSNLSNASKLGPAIATAFLATFYGISSANVFWLPVGAKLEQKSRAEIALKEMMLEGILSIQRGDNPSIVRDKLAVFLPRGKAADGDAAGSGGESERSSGEVA